jgi:hypothetical protein
MQRPPDAQIRVELHPRVSLAHGWFSQRRCFDDVEAHYFGAAAAAPEIVDEVAKRVGGCDEDPQWPQFRRLDSYEGRGYMVALPARKFNGCRQKGGTPGAFG